MWWVFSGVQYYFPWFPGWHRILVCRAVTNVSDWRHQVCYWCLHFYQKGEHFGYFHMACWKLWFGSKDTTLDYWLQWLNGHREFLPNALYIGGDSYSGMIVPHVAQKVADGKWCLFNAFDLAGDWFFRKCWWIMH